MFIAIHAALAVLLVIPNSLLQRRRWHLVLLKNILPAFWHSFTRRYSYVCVCVSIDKGKRGIGNASRDPIYLTILTSQSFDLVCVMAGIACVDIRSLEVNSGLSQPQVSELNVVHHIEQLTKP